MKNNPLGMWSCVLATLVWIGFIGGVAVIAQYGLKNDSAMRAVVVGLFICSAMAMLGVGLAFAEWKQVNRKKVLAVLGLIFNGLFLLGPMGLFCLLVIANS